MTDEFSHRRAQAAPQLWHGADAKLMNQHLRGLADALGERGEGELQLGDVLDPHSGCHADGDRLDDLRRVLAEDMSADDPPPIDFDDQLAEPVWLAVGDGP